MENNNQCLIRVFAFQNKSLLLLMFKKQNISVGTSFFSNIGFGSEFLKNKDFGSVPVLNSVN